MIHSGLFYRLDISTFYFYEPLFFEKTQNGLYGTFQWSTEKTQKNFSVDYVIINELHVVHT